jgi:hypothetical protein
MRSRKPPRRSRADRERTATAGDAIRASEARRGRSLPVVLLRGDVTRAEVLRPKLVEAEIRSGAGVRDAELGGVPR